MRKALRSRREDSFHRWYQEIVAEADLAIQSPVRGCMIIRPNGYGLWQRIQYLLNIRIEETNHENLYFPLFIPFSFIASEGDHVEGFAKEMALVTHTRLTKQGGAWLPDPSSKLTEPLVVRPTSETIIGHHFRKSIRSYRDLPLLWNQWANVVRWERRPRLFLRTSEFLWQEGHTAHADQQEAMEETLRMLEVYRSFAEDVLALPVIAGEKPAHERFPGAERTYSIEAMMQDGKALQAGTSHYLGTNFAEMAGIQYQTREGSQALCHTTSWGASTRLIGALIMTHGDDDGLRVPPQVAPRQVVIVPILQDNDGDAAVIGYCDELARALKGQPYAGEAIRVLADKREGRWVDKRWNWLKRGAPVVCEIGHREMLADEISFYRRDRLRAGDQLDSHRLSTIAFVGGIADLLAAIHDNLFDEARSRLASNIVAGLKDWDAVTDYFGSPSAADMPDDADEDALNGVQAAVDPDPTSSEKPALRGWARVAWRRPGPSESARIESMLKALMLSVRVVIPGQCPPSLRCVFSGEPADEEILIARAY